MTFSNTEGIYTTIQKKIIANFSQQASHYDIYSQVQREAANQLAVYLSSWGENLIEGPLLEIGCGTGLMTIQVVKHFQERQMIISDISDKMLTFCQSQIQAQLGFIPNHIQFALVDGETFEQKESYALIISSFALQWFVELKSVIIRILNSLKTNGVFIFSLPTCDSFPEWKEMCSNVGVPFTGNLLPDSKIFQSCAILHNYPYTIHESKITCTYPSALKFFQSMKAIGAATSMDGTNLSGVQLRRLLRYWDEQYPNGISITYNLIYGQITKAPADDVAESKS